MGGRLVRPIMPHMRFLFVGPRFCLRLPSDSTSRWTPLPLANSSHCNACSGLTPPSLCACRAHPSSTGFAGAPSEREPKVLDKSAFIRAVCVITSGSAVLAVLIYGSGRRPQSYLASGTSKRRFTRLGGNGKLRFIRKLIGDTAPDFIVV